MIDFNRSREIFLKIYPSERLANKIEYYIGRHESKVKFFLLFCDKNRWEVTLKQRPMLKLSLIYAFLPTVWDRYKEKNIPEEIFWDTMTDIRIWIDDHRARTDEDGVYELHWLMHHMNLNIFKVGRLQYQKMVWYFKTPYNKNGVEIKFGDKFLNMHIPRGAKLDYDECVKSLDMAKDFFATYFPEFPNNKYACHSWLLYPGNKNFMPEGSNILKFASLYDIIQENEDPESAYLWLYGQKFKNAELIKSRKETGNYGHIDELPQNSSLQKSTIDFIKNGGIFGEALGVIIK